jgi:hypothetical protein
MYTRNVEESHSDDFSFLRGLQSAAKGLQYDGDGNNMAQTG